MCEREEKSCSLGERAGGGTEKEKVEATPSNHRDVCEIQEPVARKEEEQNGSGASCTVHTLLASRFVLPPRDFNIPVSSSSRRKKDHHNSVRRWPKRERNNNSFVPSLVVTVDLSLSLSVSRLFLPPSSSPSSSSLAPGKQVPLYSSCLLCKLLFSLRHESFGSTGTGSSEGRRGKKKKEKRKTSPRVILVRVSRSQGLREIIIITLYR